MLHNLLSNALKFSHPQRPALISVRSGLSGTGEPLLRVQDNGLGMALSAKAGPTLQPFERQHPHIGGAGVGMYLVQRIITTRGGHLEVSSVVGEGTEFTIYWFEA